MAALSPAPPMSTVRSRPTTTRRARPNCSGPTLSSFTPSSSEATRAPVSTATSSSMALRRSPKPGALTATQGSVPRTLFTTSVASASPSTSSATTSTGRASFTTCSRTGSRSFMALMRRSVRSTRQSSRTHSIRSASVTK